MRLTKGKTISAPVFISGVLSEDTEYQVKVEDLIHQGEHFYLYQGEDIHGTKVCLKSIRYRSEKKKNSLQITIYKIGEMSFFMNTNS